MSNALPPEVRRAARRFASQRADYYLDLANRLQNVTAVRQLDLFELDASRYGRHPKGVLSAWWANQYAINGGNLAASFEGTLPDDDVAMIRVLQGNDDALIPALKDLADLAKLKSRITGTAYATVGVGLLGMALAFFAHAGVAVFVLDAMRSAVQAPTTDWLTMGKSLAEWADFMRTARWPLFGAIIALFVALLWSFRFWIGSSRAWADEHFLPYQITHEMGALSFVNTMATLTQTSNFGVMTLKNSLDVLKQSTKSPWMRWRIEQIIDKLGTSGGLDVSIFEGNVLTQEMYWRLQDVSVGQSLHQSFKAVSEFVREAWLPRLEARLNRLRWVLLIVAILNVVGVLLWTQAASDELKTVAISHIG